jgi:hypothetical protein
MTPSPAPAFSKAVTDPVEPALIWLQSFSQPALMDKSMPSLTESLI